MTNIFADIGGHNFVARIARTHNKKINANFKKGGFIGYQTFVHLMKCVQAKKNATEESGRKCLSICCIFFNEQYRF